MCVRGNFFMMAVRQQKLSPLSIVLLMKRRLKNFPLEFVLTVAKLLEISYNTMMKYFGLRMLEMGGEVRWPYDRGGS